MKKRLSVLSFLVALVFAFLLFSTNSLAIDTLAVENGKNYEDGEIIAESDSLYETNSTIIVKNNKDNKITPSGFYFYKDKTIVVYYASFSSVPESRYYEEYTGGYWYKGTLKLKSVVASESGWKATYSGTFTARVE